jgi:hypothetical protein
VVKALLRYLLLLPKGVASLVPAKEKLAFRDCDRGVVGASVGGGVSAMDPSRGISGTGEERSGMFSKTLR